MPSRRELLLGAFSRSPAAPAAAASSIPPADRVIAIGDRCLARRNVVCRSCGESCEHDAIRFSPRLGGAATPSLDAERCTGCGDCLTVCPAGALSFSHPAAPPNRIAEEFVA